MNVHDNGHADRYQCKLVYDKWITQRSIWEIIRSTKKWEDRFFLSPIVNWISLCWILRCLKQVWLLFYCQKFCFLFGTRKYFSSINPYTHYTFNKSDHLWNIAFIYRGSSSFSLETSRFCSEKSRSKKRSSSVCKTFGHRSQACIWRHMSRLQIFSSFQLERTCPEYLTTWNSS